MSCILFCLFPVFIYVTFFPLEEAQFNGPTAGTVLFYTLVCARAYGDAITVGGLSE